MDRTVTVITDCCLGNESVSDRDLLSPKSASGSTLFSLSRRPRWEDSRVVTHPRDIRLFQSLLRTFIHSHASWLRHRCVMFELLAPSTLVLCTIFLSTLIYTISNMCPVWGFCCCFSFTDQAQLVSLKLGAFPLPGFYVVRFLLIQFHC
jgi:hypothetical protein